VSASVLAVDNDVRLNSLDAAAVAFGHAFGGCGVKFIFVPIRRKEMRARRWDQEFESVFLQRRVIDEPVPACGTESSLTLSWREEDSNRRSLSQTSRLSDGTRDAARAKRRVSAASAIFRGTERSNPASSASEADASHRT